MENKQAVIYSLKSEMINLYDKNFEDLGLMNISNINDQYFYDLYLLLCESLICKYGEATNTIFLNSEKNNYLENHLVFKEPKTKDRNFANKYLLRYQENDKITNCKVIEVDKIYFTLLVKGFKENKLDVNLPGFKELMYFLKNNFDELMLHEKTNFITNILVNALYGIIFNKNRNPNLLILENSKDIVSEFYENLNYNFNHSKDNFILVATDIFIIPNNSNIFNEFLQFLDIYGLKYNWTNYRLKDNQWFNVPQGLCQFLLNIKES